MPEITEIKPQRNAKRVNIYLDGKFGFGLDLETLVKEALKVGKYLSEKEIKRIVKEGEFRKTYDKILRFATLRPRSEKEFVFWLKKHKIHESLHNELFKKLKKLDLLDDSKFAVWWIEQRQNFRPKPIKVLRQELTAKGINRDTINEVMNEAMVNEKEIAGKFLIKFERKWKSLTGFERKKKIYAILNSKGFGSNIINEILEKYLDD